MACAGPGAAPAVTSGEAGPRADAATPLATRAWERALQRAASRPGGFNCDCSVTAQAVDCAEAIAGRVAEVIDAEGGVRLELDRGRADGVALGIVFHVFRVGEYVGRVTVDRVEEARSSGALLQLDDYPARVGDVVRTHF